MHRRHFLRKAGLISLGIPLLTTVPAFGRDQLAGSLRILTDHTDRALAAANVLLNAIGVRDATVHSSVLPGNHVGDLVLTNQGRVVNYLVEDVPLADVLRTQSRHLDLPRSVQNPTLLTFQYGRAFAALGQATVYVDGNEKGTLDLRQDRKEIRIQGVGGQLTVCVHRGRLAIVEASCPHRTCMKMGQAQLPGEELLCIPNRVRIAIGGPSSLGVDVISR